MDQNTSLKGAPIIDNFADYVEKLDTPFESEEAFASYVETKEFADYIIAEHGFGFPNLFEVIIGGKARLKHLQPSKQGIPMDWKYYSKLLPITKEAITTENNIEKRRLLMMEFGIANYLSNITIVQEDAYGTLMDANIDNDEVQRFVKVRNGTEELEKDKAYLRERGMLTDDGHKIYYIPVPTETKTALEGIAWSWDLDPASLDKNGFEFET